MGRLSGILFVTFVLCLICFIAYSSQIFIIWPWYGSVLSVELISLLLPFNIFVGLLLWNYFLCVNTDPGTVPDSWRPNTHADGYEVKKLTGAPRYCRMCEKYKPPRSHHCRQCERCVLRMDHHCPWINNCVGHFNHGHFMRFLFYVDVACSYHFTMVTRRVMDAMKQTYWADPSSTEFIFILLNYVACIPVLLAVGGFSLYHFNALLNNTTTIERWEKDKAATLLRKGKISEVKFPYDLGKRRNVESVLGKNPLLWCCPTRTPGSGLRFELADRDGYTRSWPPSNREHDSQYPAPRNTSHLDTSASPWTYGNDTLNPNLQPSNGNLRRLRNGNTKPRDACIPPVHDRVPPYHPDYNKREIYGGETDSDDSLVSSGDEDDRDIGRAEAGRVRRGSEGYEVRPVNREEMLREYLESVGEDPGRYLRYIPQPEAEEEDGLGGVEEPSQFEIQAGARADTSHQ